MLRQNLFRLFYTSQALLSYSFTVLPSFSIFITPNLCLNSHPLSSLLSLRHGERGRVCLQPEESWAEESPWCWWAKGSRCCHRPQHVQPLSPFLLPFLVAFFIFLLTQSVLHRLRHLPPSLSFLCLIPRH